MKRIYFLLLLGALFTSAASAGLVAPGCTGTCGTLGTDGVVTVPQDVTYQYVSTYGSQFSGALEGLGGTNGSTLATSPFLGNAGDPVTFSFNYVTSDGSGYADYAWARLLSDTGPSIILFTARTTPGGSMVPGFEMPAPIATLNPSPVTVIPGGPAWSPLGPTYSGGCYATGCGYSGWVDASYILQTSGTYQLQVGVANWTDQAYDSGLAVLGIRVNDIEVPVTTNDAVPEPSTMLLLGAGLGLIAIARRKKAYLPVVLDPNARRKLPPGVSVSGAYFRCAAEMWRYPHSPSCSQLWASLHA